MVAVASFMVRLWFPAQSKQILDLHVWQWPQCVAMFGLGVAAARFGWARRVPERLRRGCGVAVIITVLALPVYAFMAGISDLADDAGPYQGGWHWQALLLAIVEAILVVAGSVWVLGLAQDRLQGVSQLWKRCARGSFAAFVLQAPVLLPWRSCCARSTCRPRPRASRSPASASRSASGSPGNSSNAPRSAATSDAVGQEVGRRRRPSRSAIAATRSSRARATRERMVPTGQPQTSAASA